MYNNNNNYPSIDVIGSKMDRQVMIPELSLGPSMSVDQKSTSSSLTSSDLSFDQTARHLKKRKSFNDHHIVQSNKALVTGSLDDLFLRNDHHQVIKRDRLPPDWEQCLDLKLGKMYFLNRKTAEKRWDRPSTTADHHHDQNNEKPVLELELELNISSPTSSHSSNSNFKASQKTVQNNEHKQPSVVKAVVNDSNISTTTTTTSRGIGSNNMVALACNNCHLLVILSKSSPSCPNCKYVHYLHSDHDQQPDFKESPNPNLKPISTLTLFS